MTKAGHPSRGRSNSGARQAKEKAKAKADAAKSPAAAAKPPVVGDVDPDAGKHALSRYMGLTSVTRELRDEVVAATQTRGLTREEVAAAIVADLAEVHRITSTDPDGFTTSLRFAYAQRAKHLEMLLRAVDAGEGSGGPGLHVVVLWPCHEREDRDVGDRPKTDEHDPGDGILDEDP